MNYDLLLKVITFKKWNKNIIDEMMILSSIMVSNYDIQRDVTNVYKGLLLVKQQGNVRVVFTWARRRGMAPIVNIVSTVKTVNWQLTAHLIIHDKVVSARQKFPTLNTFSTIFKLSLIISQKWRENGGIPSFPLSSGRYALIRLV